MYICNERPMYISQIAVFTYSTVTRVMKNNFFQFQTLNNMVLFKDTSPEFNAYSHSSFLCST